MAADDLSQWHIGLVGYGEVGRTLAEDLRAQAVFALPPGAVDAHGHVFGPAGKFLSRRSASTEVLRRSPGRERYIRIRRQRLDVLQLANGR